MSYDWKEIVVVITIVVAVAAVAVLLMFFAFNEANENRDKDVHMMQVCIDQGGTWLGDPASCVQPNRRGL